MTGIRWETSADLAHGQPIGISPARRATLKLQGQYMGLLRGFTPRQQAHVKVVRGHNRRQRRDRAGEEDAERGMRYSTICNLVLCCVLLVSCGPPDTSRPDPTVVRTGATKASVRKANGAPKETRRCIDGCMCDDQVSWIYPGDPADEEYVFCGDRLVRVDRLYGTK